MCVNLPGLSVFCFWGRENNQNTIESKKKASITFFFLSRVRKIRWLPKSEKMMVFHHVCFLKKLGVGFYLFPAQITQSLRHGNSVSLERVSSPSALESEDFGWRFWSRFSSCGNGPRFWMLMVQKEIRFHVDGPLLMMGLHYTIPGQVVFSPDFWSVNSTNGVHFFVEILTLGPPTWTNRYMGKSGP